MSQFNIANALRKTELQEEEVDLKKGLVPEEEFKRPETGLAHREWTITGKGEPMNPSYFRTVKITLENECAFKRERLDEVERDFQRLAKKHGFDCKINIET